MADAPHKYRFTASAERIGQEVTLVLGGHIWTDNNNASTAIAEKLLLVEPGDTLNVLIRNLYGGDFDEGLSIYHDLKSYKPTMRIDGVVASMGTVIMCAGEVVECSEHSKGMTHRPKGGTGGDFEDMRAKASENEAVYNEIADIYAERTGLSADECKALFMPRAKDVWFTPAKMKELGLVTTVTKGSLLRGTVAMRELRKVSEPDEILGRFHACLQEDEVNETENEPTMNKEIAKKLGLPEGATEAEVNAALDKAMGERTTAVARVTELETAATASQEAELKQLVEGAVAGNSLTKPHGDAILEDAKGNYAVALKMVKGLVSGLKPHTPASELLRGNTASTKQAAERAEWTYQDYMMKDPPALAAMRTKDTASFNKLKEAHVAALRNK